jgi:hypothetical protein
MNLRKNEINITHSHHTLRFIVLLIFFDQQYVIPKIIMPNKFLHQKRLVKTISSL